MGEHASASGSLPFVKRSTTEERKAGLKAFKRAEKRKVRHRRLLMQAHQEVADLQPAPRKNRDPADAIQEILDNIMAMYRYATMKVVTLEEDEYWHETIAGKIPNEWIREQERLGMQAVHVAGKAAAMGLAERYVHIQEAQAAMFGAIVEAALSASGIKSEDRRKIHTLIAEKMEDIEGDAILVGSEKAA